MKRGEEDRHASEIVNPAFKAPHSYIVFGLHPAWSLDTTGCIAEGPRPLLHKDCDYRGSPKEGTVARIRSLSDFWGLRRTRRIKSILRKYVSTLQSLNSQGAFKIKRDIVAEKGAVPPHSVAPQNIPRTSRANDSNLSWLQNPASHSTSSGFLSREIDLKKNS